MVPKTKCKKDEVGLWLLLGFKFVSWLFLCWRLQILDLIQITTSMWIYLLCLISDEYKSADLNYIFSDYQRSHLWCYKNSQYNT